MLEVLAESIGLLIMTMTGFYIIKKTIQSEEKIVEPKNLLTLLLILIPLFSYSPEYKIVYSLIAFLTNIIIYKIIFKENLQKAIILTSLVMVLTFFADFICGLTIAQFVDIQSLRGIWYNRIILNLVISVCSLAIFKLLSIKNIPKKVNEKIKPIKETSIILFLFLIIIVFSISCYTVYLKLKIDNDYLINLVLILIFSILLYIFLKEKYNYTKLINKYDSMFNYVQNFEDWIEKEQLNRHEYKNQLAVLRELSREKKVKNKIDELLEYNISIEKDTVNQLKKLPKGGIKGLMYYKLVIAQKNKINLTVDVSIKKQSILKKLTEKQLRDLCNLIGIYFDNAIEAAKETKKKNVLIEIYELKDKVNIVFSNTFKKAQGFNKRYKKGVSSKGKGHGNGLYFANKILLKSNWLEEKQDIIDGYYIQKLSILKLEK